MLFVNSLLGTSLIHKESHHRCFPFVTSLIYSGSHMSPTKSLFDVSSRRISIFIVSTFVSLGCSDNTTSLNPSVLTETSLLEPCRAGLKISTSHHNTVTPPYDGASICKKIFIEEEVQMDSNIPVYHQVELRLTLYFRIASSTLSESLWHSILWYAKMNSSDDDFDNFISKGLQSIGPLLSYKAHQDEYGPGSSGEAVVFSERARVALIDLLDVWINGVWRRSLSKSEGPGVLEPYAPDCGGGGGG
ncbi:hypothetical protein Tco_1301114 [Tanacetum coccineum]